MSAYIGESAALLTAVLWAFTTVFFTSASRRIGSFNVNMIRIPIALVIIASTVLVTTGRLFPEVSTVEQVYWLIASGIIGLVLGDTFLFRSLVILGPRLGTLIFGSWPIMTVVLSWILLDEVLDLTAIAGITVAFSGIAWVTSERKTEWVTKSTSADAGSKRFGVFLALIGGFGQAAGLVMAKYAMGDDLAPIEASYIRMIAACATIWTLGGITGKAATAINAMKRLRPMLYTLGGAICGPFLGIWMSLVAVTYTETGVAAAIMASVPVVVIPVTIIVYKQKPSARAILGALVTTVGIALLFLR
ncbi:MAG: DMT family transporter [candidate division Zixibacteria bacterium]|nr:DMT family transporter [candidate division Zixibacteria bacterium]